jgi:hypothetical protein
MVEFVSYTGKFPNLCSGILTLKIDGKEVNFGHDYTKFDYKTSRYYDSNYDSFWSSGGHAGYNRSTGETYCGSGRWIIHKDELPKQYQDMVDEIDEVFNDNVSYGCCGGCI